MEKIIKVLLILWCILCGSVEVAATISVWKKTGALPGAIVTAIFATPWLLLLI